jgi:serine/threonine protein kinase/CHASE2 domain-containing sensor protein
MNHRPQRPTDQQNSLLNADETLPLTEKEPTTKPLERLRRNLLRWSWVEILPLMGLTIGSAVLAGWNPLFVQRGERELQNYLQQAQALQLPVEPPEEIVIVAVDDDSLNQLEPSRLKRRRYAQVINRLMAAGVRAIALDIVFDVGSGNSPNPTGLDSIDCAAIKPEHLSEDDRLLQLAIDKHHDRLVLAAQYDIISSNNWLQTQLTRPYCPFQSAPIGTINFPIEPDQKIHQFGNQFTPPNFQIEDNQDAPLPLADALIQRVQFPLPEGKPKDIPFLGIPGQAFQAQTVPLWHILSDENWNSDRLRSGAFFKNRLVLIGATATSLGDRLETPVGRMSGVELHAHALAARLRHRQIRNLLPQSWQNALLVLGLVGLMSFVQLRGDAGRGDRKQRPIWQIPGWLLLMSLAWLGLGYASLVLLTVHLPLVFPTLSFSLAALMYPLQRWSGDRKTQEQLRSTLKRYGNSPLIQEIIEQQNDPSLRNLLTERQEELQGKKLGGRYEITEILGSGGFAETYKARDMQLPGTPICVVKQLRPRSDSLNHLALARRLFDQEALTLQELGRHDRIPQLLAFFEENQEFYLIQQFIPGTPLSQTLTLGRQLPEANVISILVEILTLLNFVHHHQVIHRDIKPSNIIQRSNDQHLVLIDFGAVKALESLPDPDQPSDLTVGIGTQGYMAPEQQLGNPRPSSDLYSLGILAIQALTGLPARQFIPDPETQTIAWESHITNASRPLKKIVNRLTAYHYRDRYQSASEALTDLQALTVDHPILPRLLDFDDDSRDFDVPTQLWNPDGQTAPAGMPVTEQPPTDPLP